MEVVLVIVQVLVGGQRPGIETNRKPQFGAYNYLFRDMENVKKFFLSIILTEKCNLKCSYCYENNKSSRTINANIAKQIISDYLNNEKYDEVEIDLFGGEPFLEFEKIKEICEWTWSQKWKNKYLFFTTTNGTLVHGEIKDWLRKNKDYFWVSVSLDGCKESHDINRCNSFDDIDIGFFFECWPLQTVKMTISKNSISNLANNVIILHSFGYKIAGTNFAEGIDWENAKYQSILFEQMEKLCIYYLDNPNIEPVSLINMPLERCEIEKHKKKDCGCGSTMATYGVDGVKYPCTFFTPMTFSKKQLDSLKKIDWNNEDVFTDEYCYEKCYLFPVCNTCYGANLLQSGTLNIKDKSKCELVKIRAVFSAALAANRLLKNPIDTYKNYLISKAIYKINDLYNK